MKLHCIQLKQMNWQSKMLQSVDDLNDPVKMWEKYRILENCPWYLELGFHTAANL